MSPIRGTRRVTQSSGPIPIIQHDRVLRSHKASTTIIPTPSNPTSQAQSHKRRRRRAGADPWTPYRKLVKTTTPRPRVAPPTHFTCRICAEEQPVTSFIEWVPASRKLRYVDQDIPRACIAHLCRNPRKKANDPVCKTCIGRAMASKLEMTGARTLSTGCLEPGCTTPWDFPSIMKHLPLASLEAYNMGMLAVWKESVKLFTCVSEACNGAGILDPLRPGYPQVECPECKNRICATCKIPWHTGMSCAEHAAKSINEQMTTPEKETLKFMQTKDGKRCPNCYIVIEKDGGCNSMHCMGCNTYFNWESAASAVPGTKPVLVLETLDGVNVTCEIDAINKAYVTGGLNVEQVHNPYRWFEEDDEDL